jgi:predicted RNA binding protein YcfA (HicA-like mRNA interferase family)
MTAREVMARLQREGWQERPGKGAHVVFTKPGRKNIPVSRDGGDVPIGTLRSIARDAGWEWLPER